MQGHEVMATLDAEHIPEAGKLSAAQVFETVQRIEDDLWHVMEGSVLVRWPRLFVRRPFVRAQ